LKTLTCPLNSVRNIDEFFYGGEFRVAPDPDTCTDEEWCDYLYQRDNPAGQVKEWWQHGPSGGWFIVVRDTVTDQVIETIDPATIFSGAAAGGSGT
jgi:sarcosine oxidase subunit delta